MQSIESDPRPGQSPVGTAARGPIRQEVTWLRLRATAEPLRLMSGDYVAVWPAACLVRANRVVCELLARFMQLQSVFSTANNILATPQMLQRH